MVTGFEVFGAVSGALGTLNLVRQLLESVYTVGKDWAESGRKLLEVHDGFQIFIVRLETWSERTWSIDAEFNDDVGKAFWGDSGWRSISIQLAHIDKTAEEFLVVFKKAADPAIIEKLLPQHGNLLARAEQARSEEEHDRTGLSTRRGDSVRKLRELGDRLTKCLSPVSKVNLIISRAPVLLDMLAALDARFLLLERDANAFYESQHPTVPRSVPQQQRLSTAEGTMLLRNIKATKAASEALYRACGNLKNEVCTIDHRRVEGEGLPKLEMNLLAAEPRFHSNDDWKGFAMRYHLVLTSPEMENELEVLVEGPLHAPQLQAEIADDFAEACRHIRVGRQCYFEADLEINSRSATMFRLSSPLDPLRPWETKSIHLSGLLGAIEDMTSFQASGQFPYTERLNLAFKVAECGLLLIGTSWLSSIDSRNVQRLSDPSWKTKRRFIFAVKATENEHLANVEPHLFRIGKLLAEIAMGLPVRHIATFDGPQGPELDLVISVKIEETKEMRAMPAVEVEQRVRQAMGLSYSKAVAFCLQQSSDAQKENWGRLLEFGTWKEKEEAYMKLLANYHKLVYLP
ncbi:hypothetical protein EPUS_07617 [Endocarpon pusillum Z07020]|uniref:Uncharacterized protein n=1 Tax=Endocarpon pusillum (strain Z07020 / HMAS-L-300199) TaxID=1263415 RepID=U1FZI2_ENDPU|nr:uncharacterized protein EPUS_07617 [Endocarpon pusillum Z07020]ERF70352.1 hypothetical protein EPUS_07617 [Endocarpon pusillum Z07020]